MRKLTQPFDASNSRPDMADNIEAVDRKPRCPAILQQCVSTKLYQWFTPDGALWQLHGQPFRMREPRAATSNNQPLIGAKRRG